jgi:4-amino-4-deoxyprephenate dehydrogenase
MNKKAIILGINGGFGSLLSGLLFNEGLTITGVDLNNEPNQSCKYSRYISSDVKVLNQELGSVLKESDLIILCLPEDVSYEFFKLYEEHILKSALVIDTLSVKREIASIYEKNDFNALSLNPMFGPDLAMEGKNIIVIKFKDTQLSDWFISLLEIWGLNVVYTTSDEHDKMSSIIQVATHAAIMAFGITLTNSDFSMTDLMKVATPPFLNISALFGRIIANKKVYYGIQKENVYASGIRITLIKNLILLDKSIDEGVEADFNKLTEVKTEDQKEIFMKLSKSFSSQLKTPNL